MLARVKGALAAMSDPPYDYDVCVVGGGINGTGIARDAAGRGLRTLLLEKGDLGGATSSASTKLVHGGLRYLEYYAFRLVREALREREILLGIAPHLIRPMRFMLPHDPSMRPAWMVQIGLFLYDRLGGRTVLEPSQRVKLDPDAPSNPLSPTYRDAFLYSDGWVDDSRLVALNAVDAWERGARILTRTACTGLESRGAGRGWQVAFGAGQSASARILINATGPWVNRFLQDTGQARAGLPQIRLVKGSHIVVPAFLPGPHAYILQQPDRRVVFAIPYLDRFTLVGTTEEGVTGDPAQARISADEIAYLFGAMHKAFKKAPDPGSLVWSFSGVRPLVEDSAARNATAASRDYRIVEGGHDGNALISIFGGKITTYRALAQEVVNRIAGPAGSWTAHTPLPGGDIGPGGVEAMIECGPPRHPSWPADTVRRLACAYGTRMNRIVTRNAGDEIAPGLFEAEILYLRDAEFAQTAEDILWRRTKLGLFAPPDAAGRIDSILRQGG